MVDDGDRMFWMSWSHSFVGKHHMMGDMTKNIIPICSMYGIFTYIWVIFGVNVGKYSSTMEHMGFEDREKISFFLALHLHRCEFSMGP